MKDYSVLLPCGESTMIVIHDAFDKGYKQGYKDGKADTPFTDTEEAEEKAYNRGLNEAWKAAKKIHDGQISYEVFGLDKTGNGLSYASPLNWGETITAQEVIAKIKKYEDKQKQDAEIKVGDEIRLHDAIEVVTSVMSTGLQTIDASGNTSTWYYHTYPLETWKKTGRHFPQIAEVMKEMRGAENDE